MVPAMGGPIRDLIHAWRGLKQKPGFLIGALLTLAIGIGANVTIFSLVNGLSLRPMPFGDRTDRLVTIHSLTGSTSTSLVGATPRSRTADFLDFRGASTVEGIGGYMSRNFRPERR